MLCNSAANCSIASMALSGLRRASSVNSRKIAISAIARAKWTSKVLLIPEPPLRVCFESEEFQAFARRASAAPSLALPIAPANHFDEAHPTDEGLDRVPFVS